MPSVRAVDPPITDLAFSNDGSSLIAVSQSGIQIYSPERRYSQQLSLIQTIQTNTPNLHSVVFAPDGKHIAVGGGTPSEEGVVEIYRWPSCEFVAKLAEHLDSVQSVVWIDDQRLLSASIDREIKLWNLKNDSRSIGEFRGHSRSVSALCRLPGGKSFVSAGVDQSLRVWELNSQIPVRTLSQHTGAVHALALRPGGEGLPMVASASDDRTIRFWQPTIGRMVRYIRLDSIPLDVAWLGDGVHIAAACTDGKIRIINAEEVRVVGTESVMEGWTYAVDIHPKPAVGVAGGSGGFIRKISIDLPAIE